MKKALVLALALTLIVGAFALVGCAKKAETPSTGGSTLPAEIQAIKDRGTLNVGVKVDVPNFGYKDPATNEIDGLEIDLARKIAEKIIGADFKLNLVPVTADTRGAMLDNGQLDIVAATFTIKPDRLEKWNFSNPYFTDEVGLLVMKAGGFTSLKDLNGKTVGVAQGATTKDAVKAQGEVDGVEVKFSEFASYPEINAALESGRIDAFSVDKSILSGYLTDTKVILADGFSPQDYGIASKKSNTELAKLVNDVLDGLKADGTMDELLAKWNLAK